MKESGLFYYVKNLQGGESADDPEMNPENDPEMNPENDLELFSRKSQLHLTGRVNDWKLKIAG